MQKFMIIPSGFDMKNVLSIPHADLLPVFVTLLSVSIALAWRYYTRKPKGCLDPEKFQEFKLVKKTAVSPNVARFRFALPSAKSVLGLPTGYHLVCRGQDSEGKEVTRKYTPVTLDSDVGYFELVIKMYPHGRMSHHFRKMQEGDYLAVKGPTGRFGYKPGQVRAFGMIAGGSGITPMFQVTRAILENPKDKTNLSLIYANTTFQDILLKFGAFLLHPDITDPSELFTVGLQPPTEGWNGGRGRVTKDMIQSYCPPPASDIQVLRCGPPGMNKAMAAHLNELGYTANMQFEF
ncbi:NADH--cytochrome b5 reductase 1 [Linum perenne]